MRNLLPTLVASARTAAVALSIVGLPGCFPLPADIPSAPRSFDAAAMEGTWYILATNFPTWTSGENTETRLIYKRRAAADGVVELDDRVEFLRSGEPSSYVGFDTQDPANDVHFTWRGDGLLALFPTEWYVAVVDPRGRWMITYYSDTVPALHAVDVIARTPTLPEEDLADALAAIDRDPFLKPRSAGLRRVWLYGPPSRARAVGETGVAPDTGD